MKNKEKILTKPEKLAQIIYVAFVRYTKAKKSPITKKTSNFGLDFSCLRSGNENRKIDTLENNI